MNIVNGFTSIHIHYDGNLTITSLQLVIGFSYFIHILSTSTWPNTEAIQSKSVFLAFWVPILSDIINDVTGPDCVGIRIEMHYWWILSLHLWTSFSCKWKITKTMKISTLKHFAVYGIISTAINSQVCFSRRSIPGPVKCMYVTVKNAIGRILNWRISVLYEEKLMLTVNGIQLIWQSLQDLSKIAKLKSPPNKLHIWYLTFIHGILASNGSLSWFIIHIVTTCVQETIRT